VAGLSKECDDFDFFAGLAVFEFSVNSSTVDGPVLSYPPVFRPFLPILELLYIPPTVSVKVCYSPHISINNLKSPSSTANAKTDG